MHKVNWHKCKLHKTKEIRDNRFFHPMFGSLPTCYVTVYASPTSPLKQSNLRTTSSRNGQCEIRSWSGPRNILNSTIPLPCAIQLGINAWVKINACDHVYVKILTIIYQDFLLIAFFISLLSTWDILGLVTINAWCHLYASSWLVIFICTAQRKTLEPTN